MAHPESLPLARAGGPPLPLYPVVAGLHQGRLRRLVGAALERLPELPSGRAAPRRSPCSSRASPTPSRRCMAQAPRSPQPTVGAGLAFDELLAMHLALGLVRRHRPTATRRPTVGDGRLQRALLARLPFAPTSDQAAALGRGPEPISRTRRPVCPPPAGRRGLGQDAGRLHGDADRGGGRAPGRADGAHRAPGAPAPSDAERLGSSAGPRGRPRRRWRCEASSRAARRPGRGPDAHGRGHARAAAPRHQRSPIWRSPSWTSSTASASPSAWPW